MCKRDEIKRKIIEHTTKVDYYIIKPYILCEMIVEIDGKRYRSVKHAIQGKNDTWNETLGKEVAFGRALIEVAKRAKLLD